MTFKLLVEICLLFVGLFIVGTIACLPAYHWQLRRFLGSRLWTKVYWWIPIFTVFCIVLFLHAWAAGVVVAGLVLQAIREIKNRQAITRWYVWAYFGLFTIGLVHLPLLFMNHSVAAAAHGLISICFASVLSDVCAFFAGTYLGKHSLPRFINPHKSYEGVSGQIIGAWLGLGLVAMLPEIRFDWGLALGVGLASALGDIINSIVKRRLAITDWGDTIPGHGGVLDRFASLALAFLVGYWLL